MLISVLVQVKKTCAKNCRDAKGCVSAVLRRLRCDICLKLAYFLI